ALLADQDAGPRRVQEHGDQFAGALDLDLGDGRERPLLLDEAADLLVLEQELRELLLARVPSRAPELGDRDAEAGRVRLLSHGYSSPAAAAASATPPAAGASGSVTCTWMWQVRFLMGIARPCGPGRKRNPPGSGGPSCAKVRFTSRRL